MRFELAALLSTLLLAPAAARAGDDRCDAALELAARDELPRAHLALEACLEAEPQNSDALRARRRVRRQLEAGKFAEVTVATLPEGGEIEIASLGARVRSPATLWLPFGEHTLRATLAGHAPATRVVSVAERVRMSVVLELGPGAAGPSAGRIDFDPAAEPANTARDPEGPEHESLLPSRFGTGPGDVPAPPAARRSRWPYGVGIAGLAALGAGAALELTDRDHLGAGLLVGGGAATLVGAAGLIFEW